MPSPVWISGRELATIWVSRIARNMPTAMATNPIQVLIPTPPADNGAAVILGLSPPSPRGEDALLDPDAPGDQHEVKGRKYCRDCNRPEGERQRRDLGDYQQIIRMPEIAEWTRSHEGSLGQVDDPRRPIGAQTQDDPEPAQLKQREETEQRPDWRGSSGHKKGEARQPSGMQQNEEWVALGIRLYGTLPAQPDRIAVRPAELDAALQQDQSEGPVEHGHRLSSTRKPAVKPGPSAFISARSQRSPVARAAASVRSSTNSTVVADMLP